MTCVTVIISTAGGVPTPISAPAPTDNTGIYILFGAIVLGAVLLFGSKR